MGAFETFYRKAAPYVLSVTRVIASGMFLLHGSQKLFNWPAGGHGAAPLLSLVGVGGVLEFVGGLLLLLGLGVRPTAFILCGEMAVAYFLFHVAQGGHLFFPLQSGGNGGEMAVLYCFVFLYFWFAGGGPLSLDALFRRPARTPEAANAGEVVR
jgi:putative oxidoreductase